MMSRKWFLPGVAAMCIVVLSLTASASVTDPNIITGVVRLNSTQAAPVLVNGGLLQGAQIFSDRPAIFYGDVGAFVGLDYIQTAMDDKTDADVEYRVAIDKPGKLFLIVDNRVGDGVSTDPPTLGSGVMDWAVALGFTPSSFSIGFNEPSTVYELALSGDPNTISLGAQNNTSSRAMYAIAAAPAGWNFPPVVTGVPETVQVSPGDTLAMNALVSDDGIPGTGISVQWTVEATPSGATVEFSPDGMSENVVVSFSDLGAYTLKFTADDGEKVTVKTIQVAVQIPVFAFQATQHLNACNDTQYAPTSRQSPTVLAVRNYSDATGANTRRRIGYHKYDISALKETGKVFANCYLTFNVKSTSSTKRIYVYAINEEQDNFDLSASSASWATAPGIQNEPLPPRSAEMTIDLLDKRDIYPILMPFQPVSAGIRSTPVCVALDEVMNADDDGTIMLMFITYDPQNADFEFYSISDSRTDPDSGKKGIVLKGEKRPAVWATRPSPQINTTASIGLTQLSWVNPAPSEPEGVITCDVYIGTGEPNSLIPDYGFTSLGVGVSGNSIVLPHGLLQRNMTYNWIVDVHDSSREETARGHLWTFSTTNNAPSVTVGAPQYLWLNNAGDPASATAHLSGTVSDDGYPAPYTILWSLVSGPEGVEVTIDPNDVEDITVVLPAVGTYYFGLTADDTDLASTSTIQVFVGDTPCDAAKAKPGYTVTAGDFNNDCFVGLDDFSTFAQHWLECHSFMDVPCY